jgi:DNA polymerase-3 subunit gamma/tau
MSYQVLARKWRPQNFSEMAGQAHVLQTLTHALEQQRLHHAYLFTGTRGVGKTTVARILARCLNCEQGITATPCGECNACREISEGRFIDLIEVDAASRTRVEDTRDLLDNVQYAPARGRFKVYLIDEVHMLSTHSFNALLKTLEEPPAHVKFLLATTDPQKLPVTVLSRCLQFHLKNLAPAQIVTYLQSVLAAEQIEYQEDALWQLGRAAAGSMRDALTLLDQSISFGGGSVQMAAVTSLLGTPDHAAVFAFLDALAQRDGGSLIAAVSACAENNPDYSRLLEQLLSVCHRLALAQVMPDTIDNSEGDREQIRALAGAFAAEDVQLYYQICMQTLQDMPHSPDARSCFEMGLLRMLAFSPDVYAGATAPAGNEKKKPDAGAALTARPASDVEQQPQSASQPEPEPVAGPEPAQEPAQEQGTEPAPAPASVPEPDPEPDPEPETKPEAEPELALEPVQTPEPGDDNDWYALVQRCQLSGITGNILANCVPVSATDGRYMLILDQDQSALYSDDQQPRIAQALSETLQRSIAVEIRIGALPSESPAQRRRREKQQAIDELHHRFNTDPGVLALIAEFDARVDQASLQIVKGSA